MKDIEALKASKLQELSAHEQQYTGSMDALMQQEEAKTLQEIELTKTAFQQHKDKVIARLLENVLQVDVKIHENYHQ